MQLEKLKGAETIAMVTMLWDEKNHGKQEDSENKSMGPNL